MNVAIIPARGGSKRIPRKNIRSFCGRPMLAWSIQAALDSGCFNQVIVSTDDDEIAEISLKYGATVPFLRPKSLSDDFTGTLPVVAHATAWIQDNCNNKVKNVCCLYATAPFVTATSIRRGLEVLERSQADYAFTVTSYAFPIQRAVRVNESGRLSMFNPELFSTRSQDLEEAFHDAGQFYWGKAAAWLVEAPLFSSASTPVMLPRYLVQDIDNEDDWVRAELMFQVLKSVKSES